MDEARKRGVFVGCDTALFKILAFIARRKFDRGDCETLSADFTLTATTTASKMLCSQIRRWRVSFSRWHMKGCGCVAVLPGG